MPLTPQEKRERQRALHRAYYRNNKEKLDEKRRQRHRKNPDQANLYYRRRHEAEAGRPKPNACEVCGRSDMPIHFDHCHERGVFRGWICFHCNAVLGHINDDPNRLRQLIAYLERTKNLISPQLELPV